MEQYINKSALVAEIRKRLLPVIRDKHYDEWEEGQNSERIAILDIINTLEVKGVDLGKAYDDFLESRKKKGYMLFEVAKHFFELGLQVNNPITAVESTERHLKEPTIVYVVSRSEEHSDYVEEAFLDEREAKKYCDQFNGDENEYVRYITKVKLTL